MVAYRRHPLPESVALMKALNIGTVKAVWPWVGLQIIPCLISPLRSGPVCCMGAHAHAHALGDVVAQALVGGGEVGGMSTPSGLPIEPHRRGIGGVAELHGINGELGE